MGAWVHKLSGINTDALTGVCAECGPVKLKLRIVPSKTPPERYTCTLSEHKWDAVRNGSKKPYTRFKGDTCSACGFMAKHRCQLDVHHIDRDHSNNAESNLRTLCANCHRLAHSRLGLAA